MIDGCECVSAWSWLALGFLLGVLVTLALAAATVNAQFAKEDCED
jgi:hypothetical protein